MKLHITLFLALGLLQAQSPVDRVVVCTDSGASDAYTCNPVPAVTAYATGMKVRLRPNTANTGAATVAISGLSAVAIKKVAGGITTDVSTNDIRAGQYVELVYDGTNFQMLTQLGNEATQTVSSVFGRTGAITASGSDYSGFYPSLSGSYSNPSWITSLAWGKVTGAPSFVDSAGSYVNPSWISSLAWAKITGTPSYQLLSEKNQANGYAGLDASSLLPVTSLPAFTGDVTKTAGSLATVVTAIQGRAVLSSAPSNGQTLVFHQGNNRWEFGTGGVNPVANGLQSWNGSNWVARSILSGDGVEILNGNGFSADPLARSDRAVVPFYSVSNTTPTGVCSPGDRVHIDTSNGTAYWCVATDTFRGTVPFNGARTNGRLLVYNSSGQAESSSIPASDVVTAPNPFTANVPLLGGGSDKTVVPGSRSGNTTEFATVSGAKTQNKQLTFDANGNIIASGTDVGAGGGGGGGVYIDTKANNAARACTTTAWWSRSTNSPMEWTCNGSSVRQAWIPGAGAPMTPPSSATGWSWVNQGTSTVAHSEDGILLRPEQTVASGSNMRLYLMNRPTPPYTIEVFMRVLPARYNFCGLVHRDSTNGKLDFWGITNNDTGGGGAYTTKIMRGYMSNPTTWGGSEGDTASNNLLVAGGVWLRVSDDLTNFYYSWSVDGNTWTNRLAFGRTNWLGFPTNGGDQVGIVSDGTGTPAAAGSGGCHIYSWRVY